MIQVNILGIKSSNVLFKEEDLKSLNFGTQVSNIGTYLPEVKN